MKRLAIIGSGDLGRQITHHVKILENIVAVGFFDDYEKAGLYKYGIPVLGNLNSIDNSYKNGVFDEIIIAIGYKHFFKRAELFEKYNAYIPFASIIHPSSFIDKSCKIGKGVFIYAGCVLDMNVEVGNNSLIYNGCILSHDSKIGFNSFLCPAVKIAGFVSVGNNVFLGIGTTVIDNIIINDNISTGGATVVTKSLMKRGLYVGAPARYLHL